MALFHKLFIPRKCQNKNQDNVSERLFSFSKDQVRVMLFRECDFRGRKLLFDSDAVKRIPLDATSNAEFSLEPRDKNEGHSGYGYKYSKPHPEFNQLLEMIFGSVAMSFRGSYFKIHSISSPERLMFSHVFPSPHHTNKRILYSSRTCLRTSTQNSENSCKLDDSGTSSTNSFSEQLSVHSTASDTLLVCRKRQRSSQLDVSTQVISASNPSIVGDSGCGDQSFSSFSSEPNSLPSWDNAATSSGTFSSSSDYRKWLRSTSTSLDHSSSSLPGCTPSEEFVAKPPSRSKLGFALIIQITSDHKENLVHFLMEHVALIEAYLWRSRRKVELAHCRPQNFLSLMINLTESCGQWLCNLLSGPRIKKHLWLSLACNCDNNSISAFSTNNLNGLLSSSASDLNISNSSCSSSNSYGHLGLNFLEKKLFFNLSSFFKSEESVMKKNVGIGERNFLAEKFLKELCELLETIDVKDTNFFMSTLLTAVLTHHLGWVATSLPVIESEDSLKVQAPFNALWGQLSDLFGVIGFPCKMTQTVILGTNKKEEIAKILKILTYFVRCCDIERRSVCRCNIEEENQVVRTICQSSSCIPKENYKTYQDHLNEMMEYNDKKSSLKCFEKKGNFSEKCSERRENGKLGEGLSRKGLQKVHSCVSHLADLSGSVHYSNNNCSEEYFPEESNDNIENWRKGKLDSEDVLDMALLKLRDDSNQNIQTKLSETNKIDSDSGTPINSDGDKGVVFVLGDDEELVGLRREHSQSPFVYTDFDVSNTKLKRKGFSDKMLIAENEEEMIKRPSCSSLKTHTYGEFSDDDFILNKLSSHGIKPSASWAALNIKAEQTEEHKHQETQFLQTTPSCFTRSQSVPPEERKDAKPETSKSKYRYSGYKFSLQQYPQILENYLKSKNLEIASFKFSMMEHDSNYIGDDSYNNEEIETLQTPSNASEMEFTADLLIEKPRVSNARESSVEPVPYYKYAKSQLSVEKRNSALRNISLDCNKTEENDVINPQSMKVTNFPMPRSVMSEFPDKMEPVSYTSSLLRSCIDGYIPDVVLQGISLPKTELEHQLKNDLVLASQHSLLDQPVEEAVAIVANLDTWEVQIMSSHTYVIDKGSSGIRVGMSQLVASMVESLLHMWKLRAPPDFCLRHLEQKLQELCIKSKSLAQLLLASEFCTMEHLTSTLHLEVNDVPLLMAVASTHSPQVTQKYGLSFV